MLFLQMWFKADGTSEYGQSIRWLYLYGYFGKDPKAEKRLDKLDNRNFKKWRKIHQQSMNEYLKFARV